jgi:hypothetical protein
MRPIEGSEPRATLDEGVRPFSEQSRGTGGPRQEGDGNEGANQADGLASIHARAPGVMELRT